MVGVDEEQDIEGLLEDWVWSVILFAQVVHLVQEGASVTQAARRRNEVTPLTDTVCHPKYPVSPVLPAVQVERHPHDARVIAFPMRRYICLSIVARDISSPLVYRRWPSSTHCQQSSAYAIIYRIYLVMTGLLHCSTNQA